MVIFSYAEVASCCVLQAVAWIGATAASSICTLAGGQWCSHTPPGQWHALQPAMQRRLWEVWW